MRVLVTGAAGFIGSNLAHLLSSEHEVVGLDNFLTGNWENLRDFRGDFIAADLSDAASWAESVGKVDAVFHQAAITDTTVADQAGMMKSNVDAFRGLLRWAAERGVKRVVYATSAAVYGDGAVPMREAAAPRPRNIYAFSKMVMEQAAADFARSHPKMTLVGLRYFNVFGPRESFKGKAASMIWQLAQQIRAGHNPRIFEFGEQYRDFIYVRDVVEANRLALKAPAGVYNVCTGRKTDFNEIIERLNAVLGTRRPPEYFKNPYGFYQNETLGDPKHAAATLKFRAKYTVAQGIEEYLGGQKAKVGV